MEAVSAEMLAARARLREKFGDASRVGGKGGARVKKRPVVHKSATGDDKKLQATIKRMGLSQLPGVDEVAMIKEDRKALCFNHPKVQVAINANTFIVTGASEEKSADQLSSMATEFSPEVLKKLAAEWQKMQKANAEAAAAAGLDAAGAAGDDEDDDDDVPDLIENFEAAVAADTSEETK